MRIVSRKEAKLKGLTNYFTGKPCSFGHLDQRNVKNKTCLTCAKLRKVSQHAKELNKQRRERNLNLFLIRERNSYLRCRNQILKRWKKYVSKHKESIEAKKKLNYIQGAANPRTELQWLLKAKAINRTVKRELRSSSPDLSLLQKLVQSLSCK